MDEPKDQPGWHLKKEVQLSHIITTLTIAAAAFLYIGKIEQRISIIESQVVAQYQRDERQDKAMAEAVELVRRQLDRMDSKLDRLVEKGAK